MLSRVSDGQWLKHANGSVYCFSAADTCLSLFGSKGMLLWLSYTTKKKSGRCKYMQACIKTSLKKKCRTVWRWMIKIGQQMSVNT